VNDGKRIVIVVLDQRPIANRGKVTARLNGVAETSRQLSENFAGVISYQVAVPVGRGHTCHRAVRPQRLRPFVVKPLVKSESCEFHSKFCALHAPPFSASL
jgi:hypothetical protein